MGRHIQLVLQIVPESADDNDKPNFRQSKGTHTGMRYGNGRILVKEALSITQSDIGAEKFKEIKDFVNTMKSEAAQRIILTTPQE